MMSQAALKAEQAIGHGDNATTAQDVTNPGNKEEWGDKSETMKALAWMGKNKVEVVDAPKPKIIEPRDVIIKITGSTVCGSDLHLLHGTVVEMQKGDILGHEFCGVVEECGSAVTKFTKGYVRLSTPLHRSTNSRIANGWWLHSRSLAVTATTANRSSRRNAKSQTPTL